MIIAIGNDHAGPDYKKAIVNHLESKGHTVINHGTDSCDSVDYPDFGHLLARHISEGKSELGFSLCGSGNGINMTVNKHPGIRSALCWNEEISRLARAHNDANICALPGRFISESEAYLIVKTFINTSFEGGRHQKRIDKISLKMY